MVTAQANRSWPASAGLRAYNHTATTAPGVSSRPSLSRCRGGSRNCSSRIRRGHDDTAALAVNGDTTILRQPAQNSSERARNSCPFRNLLRELEIGGSPQCLLKIAVPSAASSCHALLRVVRWEENGANSILSCCHEGDIAAAANRRGGAKVIRGVAIAVAIPFRDRGTSCRPCSTTTRAAARTAAFVAGGATVLYP